MLLSQFEKLKLPSYGTMPGVAFHCSDLQMSENGPRVLIFGGQRQGISGAMYSFEQSSGDGFLLMPEGVEGSGPPPPARTQATLTSYGAEPQTQLLLFAGFVLNVGCVNDLWRVTISLDAASMPVPSWEQLEASGEAPEPRYGHSATLMGSKIVTFGGQNTLIQFNDCHVLDPVAAAWSSPTVNGTPPMVRMKHTASAITPSTLLVFGGFNKTERVMADCYKLDLSGDGGSVTWNPAYPEVPAGSKSIPARAQHSASVTPDGKFLFIFGGYDGAKSMNDLWLLELASMSLRNLGVETPAPEPRSRHTTHICGETALLHIFGGYDGGKPVEGNVYTLDVSDPASLEGPEAADGKDKKDAKKDDEGGDEDA